MQYGETVVLMILFTVAVVAGSRNPVETVHDMPEPIINRCLELGLIDETKKASSPETRRLKICTALVIALILAVFLYFVNIGVDRYRSPVSGSNTTMVLPLFSERLASSVAA